MGFITSENHKNGLADWTGEWLSLAEFPRHYDEVWKEIAEKKGLPEKTLKSAISSSLTGKSGVKRLIISCSSLTAVTDSGHLTGEAVFTERRKLKIKKDNDRFNICYEDGTVLYSYYSFQSKYDLESEYYLYIYRVSEMPWKYISITDIDQGTENTRGSCFHICFTQDMDSIMKKGQICTFAIDNGTIPELLRSMYGI